MTESTPEPISEPLQHNWCILSSGPVLHPGRSTQSGSLPIFVTAAIQFRNALQKQSGAFRVPVASSVLLTTLLQPPRGLRRKLYIMFNPCQRRKMRSTATTKSLPKGAHNSTWRELYLSPHSSLLSPRLWAVGPIRPSLVRGLRPRNAPSPTTSRRSQWVGNTKLPTRVGPRYPRLLADSENVPARARQARPLPYAPNIHRDEHREPATEMLTVHSPRTDRTQCTRRT